MNEVLKKIDKLSKDHAFPQDNYGLGYQKGISDVKSIVQAEQKETPCYLESYCEMREDGNCKLDGPCPHQTKIKTKGDVMRESNESLANFALSSSHNPCNICPRNKETSCKNTNCREEILKYLNQKAEV